MSIQTDAIELFRTMFAVDCGVRVEHQGANVMEQNMPVSGLDGDKK